MKTNKITTGFVDGYPYYESAIKINGDWMFEVGDNIVIITEEEYENLKERKFPHWYPSGAVALITTIAIVFGFICGYMSMVP